MGPPVSPLRIDALLHPPGIPTRALISLSLSAYQSLIGEGIVGKRAGVGAGNREKYSAKVNRGDEYTGRRCMVD